MELDFNIQPLDEEAMAAARERQAQLAKPPGSLGRLEELSIQLARYVLIDVAISEHIAPFEADFRLFSETYLSAHFALIRPLREFCVSVFRQNQEYHIINVHDGAYSPWLHPSRKVGAVCAPRAA